MKKKKIINFLEILLQIIAIFILFNSSDVLVRTGYDWKYSFFELAIGSTPSLAGFVLVMLLFIANIVICLKSSNKKTLEKDSLWHATLPIISLGSLLFTLSLINFHAKVLMAYTWSSSSGCVLLLVLVAIIFIGFIKRSNSFVPKNEITPDAINNSQQTPTNADELKKFKELLDMGAITQEEFDQKKKELLGL